MQSCMEAGSLNMHFVQAFRELLDKMYALEKTGPTHNLIKDFP